MLHELEPLPFTFAAEIPESYLDEMGHMNVMWYTHLFSGATEGLFKLVGLNAAYMEANQAGTFALQQHTRFLREVRVGQRVTLRTRMLGRTSKRFHFIHFMVNEDMRVLAATGESVGAHVDLRVRRMSPMPAAIAAAFDRLIEEHSALPWTAPVCGAMRA
jgi:acyl-CoA thioester hydrolase